MTDHLLIRDATVSDMPTLLEIYRYYVEKTAVSFEIAMPSLEEFTRRFTAYGAEHPYLVAEAEGRLIGYAYARPFVGREAYAHCVELTIYLDPAICGKGYGRRLYDALESRLKARGILNLYACIGYPEKDDEYLTTNSADFHRHLGFRECGRFTNCGRKFGRWYHMVWMEKMIGPHP